MPHYRARRPVDAFCYGKDVLPEHLKLLHCADGVFAAVFEGCVSRVREGDFIVWFEGRWKVMPAEEFDRAFVQLIAQE